MTLLYCAVQRLVVLPIHLQVDVHIKSHLTSYAKFVDGSLKSIRRSREKMALGTVMSEETVYFIIRIVLEAKLRKKCKVHQLNMTHIQKRRAWSLKLYIKLKCG
ncbi:hypothetical protein DPMN_123335 [Dreissena polymorpha]|uniref:Uncharacterized protein n=1 Tax=Dreissena polymorpha TaxID=45954 RepID=A0A9D4JRF4_DREPO|nr:hypothetical protein DPMN_123335 [Dreissena polymorpha]